MSTQHDANQGNDPIIGSASVAFGNILKLAEELKREKEAALSKISELETQLEASNHDALLFEYIVINALKGMGAEDLSFWKELLTDRISIDDELTKAREVLIKSLKAGTFDGHCYGIGIVHIGEVDAEPKEILDEEDKTIKMLKSELGDEATSYVTTALKEMNQCILSGRRTIASELWNFKEGRKATLEEAMSCMRKNMTTDTNKRQKAAAQSTSSST